MDRRAYLAASTAAVASALAGCTTAIAGERRLGEPAWESDDASLHLQYRDGDETALELSFTRREDAPAIHRLQLDIVQPLETTLDDLEYRLRPVPTSDVHAEIYLLPPRAGHAASMDTYREDDWSVLAVDAFEDGGRGTTGYGVLIHGDVHGDGGQPTIEIAYDIAFSKDGALGDAFLVSDRRRVNLDETIELE